MTRHLLSAVAAIAIAIPSAPLLAGDDDGKVWQIDQDHTQINFTAVHLKVTKVRGMFAKPTGTFAVNPDTFTKSKFDVEIDAASIDTRVKQRDEHLRSKDFFDVENHPKITFKSKKIKGRKGKYEISGDLTMRGTTKPVVLQCQTTGPFKGVFGTTRFAMDCTSTINRHDWKMSWNQVVEGLTLVSDKIDIEIITQFAFRKPKKAG